MATGHGSVIYTEEVQADYIVQMVEPVLKGFASSFDVTHEATDAWNAELQKRLEASVWTACHSWYRVGRTGKNYSIWPGSLAEQWWSLYSPIWSDYKSVGAKYWAVTRIFRRLRKIVVFGSIFLACVGLYFHPEAALDVIALARDKVGFRKHILSTHLTHLSCSQVQQLLRV